jgi:hypothetical protein
MDLCSDCLAGLVLDTSVGALNELLHEVILVTGVWNAVFSPNDMSKTGLSVPGK